MLDTETKNRINTARDILVGKVPDPKSQVEQITIALIYKFMDDMDIEAEELGGKRTFFVNGYSKYSWRRIFDPRLSGYELLNLYGEAISKMDTNPGVPKLFRDIFKNAYLPYRDPETLKSFLKVINDFEYTHSEKLGDAFEYLLSVLGSQGDAGQFRTPRHIIDFMVTIIDPKKDETILDPACGTAGFLISSYRHIIKHNSSNFKAEEAIKLNGVETQAVTDRIINSNGYNGDLLSADDRRRLADNIYGYDISPDMVRLSLVNMYLHGIKEPHISEYDTLTSEDNWHHYSDVILANPPFMSPKGGIRPHKRFSVQSNRSEVLFVNYIAEHLTANGRAAVIVPEGIIFQSGNAYKQLRKMLVEEYLVGVISLPAGVFQPYSGVKTSILWLDKSMAKRTDRILFVKINSDGYDLGAQRRAIKLNDIPNSIHDILEYKKSLTVTESKSQGAFLVPRSTIINNADHCLSSDRYIIKDVRHSNYSVVALGDVVEIIMGQAPPGDACNKDGKGTVFVKVGNFGESFPNEEEWTTKPLKMAYKGDTLVCVVGATIGKINRAIECAIGRSVAAIRPHSAEIDSTFLYYNLVEWTEKLRKKSQGSAIGVITKEMLAEITIALPSLLEQKEIVNELESYKKIIDGARMVVENYKPRIEVDPKWEMVELGNVTEVISGYAFDSKDFTTESGTKCIKITNVGIGEFVIDNEGNLPGTFLGKYSKYSANANDIVIALTRSIISGGLKVAKVPMEWNNSLINQRVACIKPSKSVATDYIYLYLSTDTVYNYVQEKSRSLMQPNLSILDLKRLPVPLPPANIQAQIISQVREVRSLIDATWKLIRIYEEKIKDRIAKVWGE